MASYNLTRTPNVRVSNTVPGNPEDPLQYVEITYSDGITGGRDWIYLPDAAFPVGITVSGTGSWSAYIEGTDSPPDVVDAGSAVAYTWPLGTVSTTSSTTIVGATAIRLNIASGAAGATPVKISVRA
jgi:hypothetical protein